MLDHNLFIEEMAKLENAFGKELKLEQLNVYEESLKEMDNERFKRAVKQILKEDVYFPKIRNFFVVEKMPSQTDSWKDHSLFWELKQGKLKAKVVPKGKGNEKPKITYKYEEMPEQKKLRNLKILKELKKQILNRNKELDYNHQEVMEAARRLGRTGRVRIEEEIIREREKLKEAKEELAKLKN